MTGKIIGTEELKKIQLQILDDVAQFCEERGLRYYLAYGTLLGAVRHKGYIPWDDDIDIHIPRPDYERFLREYNNTESPYKVVSPESESRYRVPFAKVHYPKSIVREFHFKPDVFGVYIDIFPLDGVESQAQAKECGELRRLMHVKNSVFLKSMPFKRKLRLTITKLILLPLSLSKLLKRIKSTATRCIYDKSDNVCSFMSRTAAREILPRSVFDNYVMLPFEGKEYRAPKGYDSYLKANYGDYMQLPPEEKRISHHNSEARWKE